MTDRLAGLTALAGDARADPSLVDRRILFLMQALADGTWQPGVSDHQAAAVWGVAPGTISRLVTEAGRALRVAHGEDLADVRGRLLARADDIGRQALGRVRSYQRKDGSVLSVPDPDFVSALRAQEFAARLTGALVDRHQVGLDPADSLSERETVERATDELLSDPTNRELVRRRLAEADGQEGEGS